MAPQPNFRKKNLSSIDFFLNLHIDRQSTPLRSLKILEKSVSQKSRKLSLKLEKIKFKNFCLLEEIRKIDDL